MLTVCIILIYFFEQFVSYFYFNKIFNRNRKTSVLFAFYMLSFLFQYFISLFLPFLHLLTFFLCNTAVVYWGFDAKLKQVFYHIFLLEAVMLAAACIVVCTATTCFDIPLLPSKNAVYILFFEIAASKILYFLLAFILTRFTRKKSLLKSKTDSSVFLFILPLSSIITIVSFSYHSFALDIDYPTILFFAVITVSLLFSNIVVFLVREKMVETLTQNKELQLEKQKLLINQTYYTELEKQYDASNILIHDIKKCLSNIRELAKHKESQKIISYIDSIYEGYEIKLLKQYSQNKLVNIIVSRYSQLCLQHAIQFTADIRDVDFSFITDSDLTALLDNLLENAYEASKLSHTPKISLSIDLYNENYIMIKINNTTHSAPIFRGNTFISTKKDQKLHGIGTKSILKIVRRYDGDVEYKYLKETDTFYATILLKNEPASHQPGASRRRRFSLQNKTRR